LRSALHNNIDIDTYNIATDDDGLCQRSTDGYLLFIHRYIIGTGRAPQISTGQLAHLPYKGTRCPRLFLNVKEQLAKSEDWLLIPPLPPRRYAAAAAAARRENISNRLMKFRTIGK